MRWHGKRPPAYTGEEAHTDAESLSICMRRTEKEAKQRVRSRRLCTPSACPGSRRRQADYEKILYVYEYIVNNCGV